MFWSFHPTPLANIDELLNNEGVTLEQLLDEEDVIQECKAQNSKVIDFLMQPDVLRALVAHLVTEPDQQLDAAVQYRYASIALEIVVCNIPVIIDQLASERSLLEQLYCLLEQPAPLNPLLASFFSRTLSLLIVRRPEQSWYSYQFNCLQVLEFLKSKADFVDLLLRHIGTSAIMDLLCSLISGIEAQEYRQNALNWLNEQRLVQRLADIINDRETSERQSNAAEALITMVQQARESAAQMAPEETDCHPLVDAIETCEFVEHLMDSMLSGLSEDSEGSTAANPASVDIDDPSQKPDVDVDASVTTSAPSQEGDAMTTTTSAPAETESAAPDHSPISCRSQRGSALVHGVGVLLCLLEPQPRPDPSMLHPHRDNDDSDSGGDDSQRADKALDDSGGGDSDGVSATCAAIIPRLPRLNRLLTNPPVRRPLQLQLTASGGGSCLSPPLGPVRLHVARLVSALIATGRHDVAAELARLRTVDLLLDLFFHYTLNNFLHLQLERCVSHVLTTSPLPLPVDTDDTSAAHPLLHHLLVNTQLLQRILTGLEEPKSNGDTRQESRCHRSVRAYRGHLVNMANRVSEASRKGTNCQLLGRLLLQLPDAARTAWTDFQDVELTSINEHNRPVLPEKKSDNRNDVYHHQIQQQHQQQDQFSAALSYPDFQQHNPGSDSIETAAHNQFHVPVDEFNNMAETISFPDVSISECLQYPSDGDGAVGGGCSTPPGGSGGTSPAGSAMAAADSPCSAEDMFERRCSERLSGMADDESDCWPTSAEAADVISAHRGAGSEPQRVPWLGMEAAGFAEAACRQDDDEGGDGSSGASHSSDDDSDADDSGQQVSMEVDTSDPWAQASSTAAAGSGASSAVLPMDTNSPWSMGDGGAEGGSESEDSANVSPTSVAVPSWANFAQFEETPQTQQSSTGEMQDIGEGSDSHQQRRDGVTASMEDRSPSVTDSPVRGSAESADAVQSSSERDDLRCRDDSAASEEAPSSSSSASLQQPSEDEQLSSSSQSDRSSPRRQQSPQDVSSSETTAAVTGVDVDGSDGAVSSSVDDDINIDGSTSSPLVTSDHPPDEVQSLEDNYRFLMSQRLMNGESSAEHGAASPVDSGSVKLPRSPLAASKSSSASADQEYSEEDMVVSSSSPSTASPSSGGSSPAAQTSVVTSVGQTSPSA